MSSETKNEIAIAEIKNDIGYMKSDIKEIKTDIKSLKDGFVTRAEYAEDRVQVKERFEAVVTQEEFKPIKIGLGLVATSMILAFVNSILELIKLR